MCGITQSICSQDGVVSRGVAGGKVAGEWLEGTDFHSTAPSTPRWQKLVSESTNGGTSADISKNSFHLINHRLRKIFFKKKCN